MALVVDTSAVAAIVFGEPDALAFGEALIAHAGDVHISAATVLEARIVIESRQGSSGTQDLARLLDQVSAAIVPFDAQQTSLATAAWQRYGKGRHAAGLNFGDCFSYALARHLGMPLLYKGDDFTHTDVHAAI
ncbi:type II toxin-antitoxin system VapC family toxin [Agromyces mangrovi Wang et al. 2018]|uniref:type II toxin-antitoxin system VapC family toxin n=1 Tax=Agromyces mangrovi TaxID=1858653 RepID=UPI0025745C73|nr:type II toxin-antitoxin system VapC family toxin [Agromyces mangrovi]BDZ66355.1 ribonuclease VapC [Agromyces mangrovi]